jgi:hypothetical protein
MKEIVSANRNAFVTSSMDCIFRVKSKDNEIVCFTISECGVIATQDGNELKLPEEIKNIKQVSTLVNVFRQHGFNLNKDSIDFFPVNTPIRNKMTSGASACVGDICSSYTGGCGAQACAGDVCGGNISGCGGQACAGDVCGGNASGCGVQLCAGDACGGNVGGCMGQACLGDACGGNVSGCGNQGCAGDACGANVGGCVAQACAADSCGAHLGGCVAQACAADGCAANVGGCGADACAGDYCAVKLPCSANVQLGPCIVDLPGCPIIL